MEAGTAAPVPRTPRTFPVWLRLLTMPIVIAITLVGLWLFAGKISSDFVVSMILTGVWLGLAGLLVLAIAWRWRPLALPVLGTFVVNVSGALLLGLLLGITEERWLAPPLVRTAIAIGFLSAYTTFSTLAFETVDLAESGSTAAALLNVGGSVAAGLVAVYAGLQWVGRSNYWHEDRRPRKAITHLRR